MKTVYVAKAKTLYSNCISIIGCFATEKEAWDCVRKYENDYGDYDGDVIEAPFYKEGEYEM